jgi:hypothetical protein
LSGPDPPSSSIDECDSGHVRVVSFRDHRIVISNTETAHDRLAEVQKR